jgi:hypothetical protein
VDLDVNLGERELLGRVAADLEEFDDFVNGEFAIVVPADHLWDELYSVSHRESTLHSSYIPFRERYHPLGFPSQISLSVNDVH